MTMDQKPSVGRIVHYVSYGTPGGEYGKECRAAIVTEVPADGSSSVGLAVLNPSGMFFNVAPYDDGTGSPGDPNCSSADVHGVLMSECPNCSWIEATHKGGSWHWPERV
jgi:hypothetical protein